MLRGVKPGVLVGSVLVKLSYNYKLYMLITIEINPKTCLSRGFQRDQVEAKKSYPQVQCWERETTHNVDFLVTGQEGKQRAELHGCLIRAQ